MSLIKLFLRRLDKKYELKFKNVSDYVIYFPPFESEKLKIWKEALSGDYKNYAAKFHDIIFLPQSSLSPMIVDKKLHLSQYGVPFATLSKFNDTEDVCENIELIPRGNFTKLL